MKISKKNSKEIKFRHSWKYFLDLEENRRILCLGDIDDHDLRELKNDFKETEFLKQWDQTKIGNYEKSYFDAVFVKDIDIFLKGKNTRGVLKDFFEVLNSILSDNGAVFMTFRNRFGYDRFYCKSVLKNSSRRNFSASFVMKLLERSGFKYQKLLGLIPGIHFQKLIPIKKDGIEYNALPTLKEHIKKCIFKLGVFKYIFPSYGIIAYCGQPNSSFIDKAISSLHKSKPKINFLSIHNPNTVVIGVKTEDNNSNYILRIPQNEIALKRCKENCDNLKALALLDSDIKGKAPQLLKEGVIEGRNYFIESKINGTAVDYPFWFLNKITQKAASLLIELHRQTSVEEEINDESFKRLVAPCFEKLEKYIQREEKEFLKNILGFVENKLLGKKITTVYMHGDYKIENLLIDEKSLDINGIIDWDLARQGGLPLLDLFYLIAYNDMLHTGRSISKVFIEKIFARKYDDFECSLFQEYLKNIPISKELVSSLAIMFWLHHVSYRFDPEIERMKQWLELTNFSEVLSSLNKFIVNNH